MTPAALATRTSRTAPTTDPASGRRAALLPGLALALLAAGAALVVSRVLPGMSALLVAILLGTLLANTVGVPRRAEAGTVVAGKRLLRLGIVVLGLQLSAGDILGLGAGVIAVVVSVVTLGILGTLWIGKLLGIPFMRRLLIACGFSICGAAAVAAVDGVVEADEEDAAAAIALVVVFGTLMIPLAPLLGTLVGFDTHQRGLLAGGSIHEVAQVVAAGGIIGGSALSVAVLVKLARVLMLAPVIAVIGWRQRAAGSSVGGKRPPIVPLFVAGFLAAVAMRSTVVLPAGVLHVASTAQTVLLAAAMFALGCGVRVAVLRRLGGRPVVLAALSTVLVAAVATAGVWLATA